MAHLCLRPPVSLRRPVIPSVRRCGWLLLGLLVPVAVRAEDDPLRTAENAAEKWIDLRTTNARLESDWATQKPLLESFILALNNRTEALQVKKDFLAAKTARDADELGALDSANRTALADTQAAETRARAVAARLLQLRSALPPRLSAALEMSYRSLAKPDATVNERMQIAATVLGRCVQFNRDISFGQEPLVVPGETGERVLEVIYWGLGQGYALDRSAGKAWVGRPEAGTWTWKSAPEAVAAVTTLIAVQQDKADPRFIALPAQVNATVK